MRVMGVLFSEMKNRYEAEPFLVIETSSHYLGMNLVVGSTVWGLDISLGFSKTLYVDDPVTGYSTRFPAENFIKEPESDDFYEQT